MPLTRSFDETIRSRARRDPAFRRALLQEAVDCLLQNDFATGKLLLRDCINATIGFVALAEALGKSPKSLMRMMSPEGNPRTGNLLAILHILQEREGVEMKVACVDAA